MTPKLFVGGPCRKYLCLEPIALMLSGSGERSPKEDKMEREIDNVREGDVVKVAGKGEGLVVGEDGRLDRDGRVKVDFDGLTLTYTRGELGRKATMVKNR